MYDELKIILSSVSTFANLCAVIYYIYKKIKQRDLELETDLLMFISFACLFDSASHIIYLGNNSECTLCQIQAFFLIWSRLTLLTLITLITIHIYLELSRETKLQLHKIKQYRIIYLITAFLPTFLYSIYGYFKDYYGMTAYWCWVGYDNGKYFRFAMYGFSYINIIVNLVFAILARIAAKKKNREQIEYNISYYNQYICYPLLSIIFYIVITISVILRIFFDEKSEVIEVLIVIEETSQGFWYLIISLIFSKTPQKLWNMLFSNSRPNRRNTRRTELERTIYSIVEI
jgi:hypothetical protein